MQLCGCFDRGQASQNLFYEPYSGVKREESDLLCEHLHTHHFRHVSRPYYHVRANRTRTTMMIFNYSPPRLH